MRQMITWINSERKQIIVKGVHNSMQNKIKYTAHDQKKIIILPEGIKHLG